MAEQMQAVKYDVDRLRDNLFIETAAPWAVPYIGELVGNRPLQETSRLQRADVARTVAYQRRKGTLPMLEELAADITGYSARAVDFFRLLAWSQHLNHVRPEVHRTPDFRDPHRLDHLEGPFDTVGHTVDVRSPRPLEGWHNVPNVGLFLWRLSAYPLTEATPCPADDVGERYSFNPLGHPLPLFHDPLPAARRTEGPPELAVRGPIRPLAFRTQLHQYYGPDRSVCIFRGGAPVPAEAILPADLCGWAPPPPGMVAVDVRLGRFCFAPGEGSADVRVNFAYGSPGPIGGGPYLRPADAADEQAPTYTVAGDGADFPTLAQAVAAWEQDGPDEAIVEILDSRTYTETLSLTPRPGGRLIIRAAQGQRPVLALPETAPALRIEGHDPAASVELIGLAIAGGVQVVQTIGRLRLSHCTLVPGFRRKTTNGAPENPSFASVQADTAAAAGLQVILEHCISGPLQLHEHSELVSLTGSIIDGLGGEALRGAAPGDSGPPARLLHSTILGSMQVRELHEAAASIFTAPLQVRRVQVGSVHHCYVPQGSVTPVRYRCQPDMALEAAAQGEREIIRRRLVPAFTTTRFGDPAYGQLSLRCAAAIRTGAADGGEMGAFHDLLHPQRERNLLLRLEEYLPAGRTVGLIYLT